MTLTEDDVIKTAFLARIKVLPEERHAVAEELSKILKWIDQLEQIDVKNVELYPNYIYKDSHMTERDDVVDEGNCAEQVVSNAPDGAFNMFSVPKVVE